MPSAEQIASGALSADADGAAVEGFRHAMSKYPATVNVITTGSGEARRGFTATAVFSATMDPPAIGICVNKSVDAHDALTPDASFCVNVLAVEQQGIANRFAARDGSKGASRFEHDTWDTLVTGSPCLRGALANVDCKASQFIDIGTHTLILGDVVGVRSDSVQNPLLYFDRGFRQLATESLEKGE